MSGTAYGTVVLHVSPEAGPNVSALFPLTHWPIGPWLVTADEVGDWSKIDMWLEVDGRRFQNGSTRTMVFGVPFLVSYLSRFISLQSGDMILTGTPPGVGLGQKPPIYLRAGHEVRLGVQGLGEQRQRVVG